MSEFTGENYRGYDFGKMNRERSSQGESPPIEPIKETPKRIPNHLHTTDAMTLQGRECLYKSMAQGIPAAYLDIQKDKIRDAFAPLYSEHRMERVAFENGISWVNDSASTNVNSTWFTLESTPGPIVWIMGGVDKGNHYAPLAYLVQAKVKVIILLGSGAMKIHRNFAALVDAVVTVGSMEEAVKMATQMSSRGDTVLLSPACASFDLFEDHQDRGRQFKKEVGKL